MKTWKTLKYQLLKNKQVADEYERLKPKYTLISQLITARKKQNLSQEDVAQRIGTKQSAIARLESGNTNPSIDFIEKVTQALGMKLMIQVR